MPSFVTKSDLGGLNVSLSIVQCHFTWCSTPWQIWVTLLIPCMLTLCLRALFSKKITVFVRLPLEHSKHAAIQKHAFVTLDPNTGHITQESWIPTDMCVCIVACYSSLAQGPKPASPNHPAMDVHPPCSRLTTFSVMYLFYGCFLELGIWRI